MRILLSFVPYFVFGFILDAVPVALACLIAAIVGLVIALGDYLMRGRSIKLLDGGTIAIFVIVALIAAFLKPALQPSWVWVATNAGLLAISLVSLAIRRPFTLQYAREQVGPDLWNSPVFLAVNDRITAVWALAFAVMLFFQIAIITMPGMPALADYVGSIAPVFVALAFTAWYPRHVRRSYATGSRPAT